MIALEAIMKKLFFTSVFLSISLLLATCSGTDSSPDGNAVQVDGGDVESVPRAEIPTDFVTATDALAEGNRLFDAGETEKAIDVLLQAVKMDPDLAEAYFKLGVAYSLVEAEDTSVDQPEETPTPRSKKATEKKKNSEKAFESAVTAYKKIIAKNKEDDVAHFYLGLTYNKLNEDEDAAKSLKEAVKLKPDNTEYQTELGAIMIKLAKYHEAVTALKKALELDPDNLDAEDLLEKAQAGRKRVDFAKQQAEKLQAGSNSSSNSTTGTKLGNEGDANKSEKPTPKPGKTPPVPVRTPR